VRLWCSSMRCLTRSKERRAAETSTPAVRAALVGASSELNGSTKGTVGRRPVQVALARAAALAIGRGTRAPLGKVDVFQDPLYLR